MIHKWFQKFKNKKQEYTNSLRNTLRYLFYNTIYNNKEHHYETRLMF